MATAWIGQKLMDGLKWIISRIEYGPQFISKTLKKSKDWLSNVVGSISELIHTAFENSFPAFSKLCDNLLHELDKLFKVVEEFISRMSEAAAEIRRKYPMIDYLLELLYQIMLQGGGQNSP
ncbi:hypothetical protein CDL12_08833 [Handroanthus impetiginosus]|uniref:Uncharacterized protein n=1 Tax=Handroanthus impetiginosus TaxID=429701 RepID=A0A2G9HMH0_9LAMI|nr:hypothetical protein CDL12_08833 [Handroanthus impetiginosus]